MSCLAIANRVFVRHVGLWPKVDMTLGKVMFMRRICWTSLSALGQKQTFAVQNAMSALPPKADIWRRERHVRHRKLIVFEDC